MEPGMKLFGGNVKKYREAAGFTQETLARTVGVARSALSNIEGGRRSTTSRVEMRLAQVLGVSVADLWREGGPER